MRLLPGRPTLLLLLLLLAAAWPAPARAATPAAPDPFRAAGVPVDATAESAVAARARALDDGQREGLRRVLRRLTLPEDEGRLPQVGGDFPAERYVQSFEIAQERVGPTRYLASLNVAYAPDQVRRLLRDAGVPFVERRPEPVLVLPVLRAPDGGIDLWGEANPWRAAWNEGAASGLVELRLPLGDAGDVSTVAPEAAEAGDGAALAALGERYGAPLVVLAEARPEPGPDGAPAAIAVEVRPGAGTPPASADASVSRASVARRPGEEDTALYARAVAAAVDGVELAVKRSLIVPEEDLAEITVGVPLADLRGWVQIRRTLGALPEVRSVRVDRLALSEAALTIAYAGDLDRLAGAMERAGLALVEEGGGWRLRPADGLGGFRAP
jgi:hypothetical protein